MLEMWRSIRRPDIGIQMLQDQGTAACQDDFDFWKSIPFYMRPSAAEETHARNVAINTSP